MACEKEERWPILRRVGGAWKIATLHIVHTLPMAFPGQ
jgi:hypothetical protein